MGEKSTVPGAVDFKRLLLTVAVGAGGWVFDPPAGLTAVGWQTLTVFAATIVGFVVRPLAMGPMVLLSLVTLAATGTLSFEVVVGGFGDKTVWLVVAAFLIAGTVESSGFGRRMALNMVRLLGRSTLGLGYAVSATELLLGPVVPSNTARGGGIMAPIVASLASALDSHPDDGPERAGRFLVMVGAHANLITAAMFLTGMAANPLVSRAAADVFGLDFGWGTWALGAIVPGLVGLGTLPLLIHRIVPPATRDASAAREHAGRELAEMGAWSRSQKIMAGVFVLLLVLWTTKGVHGMGTGLVAWVGILVLLLSGAESWRGITHNASAWDTLIWLGGLLAMAGALKDEKVVEWFAHSMEGPLEGLGPVALVVILGLVYFVSMYGFSMLTGHITALVAAFFALGLAGGAPPLVMVALLAYFSSLCGCTTNYSTGPVIIYYGLGYVPAAQWFRIGAIIAVFHLVVWFGVGAAWWKILGWW